MNVYCSFRTLPNGIFYVMEVIAVLIYLGFVFVYVTVHVVN